jgi:hypothetical protein
MWWWRKVRYADLPQHLRDEMETFGEAVLSHALAQQFDNANAAIRNLIQIHYWEVVSWLRERRDLTERHENRVETLEWAILIFVVAGVAADAALALHDFGLVGRN